jgi:hypothetical protein
VWAQLEEDGPMMGKFRVLLWLATGRLFRRDTSLAATAQFMGGFFWLLSQLVAV